MDENALLNARSIRVVLGSVSGVIVAYEVLLTRLLSVTTWYSLAFAVLSLAMLGIARGSIVAIRLTGEGPIRVGWLVRCLFKLCAALAIAGMVATFVPIWFQVSGKTVIEFALVSTLAAVPFVFGGTLIARLMADPAVPVSSLYAIDLACAAGGAVLPLALLGPLSATGAILLLAGGMGLCAAWVSRRWAFATLGILLCGLAGATRAMPDQLRPALGTKVDPTLDLSHPLFERWNGLSYVIAPRTRIVDHRFVWSERGSFAAGKYPESLALIDGESATPIVAYQTLADVAFLKQDVTAAAHALRPTGVSCVIGVGGGRDVLAALAAGHQRVIGADINPSIIQMLQTVTSVSPLALDPRAELHVADGRQLFAQRTGECRVLQASMVDTWAATGAGAFAHTEATLYTRDAWAGFLRAVEPDGILTFSRWYGPQDVNETSRLVALAVASLLDRGVGKPADHIALVAAGRVATILVSPEPLSAADISNLNSFADAGNVRVLLSPDRPAPTPLLGQLLAAPTTDALAAIGDPEDLDTSAPTDDNPFFFHLLKPRAWLSPGGLARWLGKPSGLMVGNVRSGLVLLLTVLVLFGLATALLAPTLVRLARNPAGTFPLRAGVYFTALGVGFMLAEVALVQRMHLVLSHPSLALIFVLAGLLAAMGAGSALSPRVLRTAGRVHAWALLASVLLAVLPFAVIRPLAHLTQALALPIRISWALACAALVGFVLGMLFPAGLRYVPRENSAPVALALNGAAGVVGGCLAVAVSVWAGIPATFLSAAALYAVAALTGPLGWKGAR